MGSPTFVLRLDRPLDRDVARLSKACADRAARVLKTPDDESVHSARKAVKRGRSVLRLVRGPLGDRFGPLDDALRAVGRRMGPLRDAAVALDLVDQLEADGALAPASAARLRTIAAARRDAARAALLADDGIEDLRAEVRALRLTPADLAGIAVPDLRPGLVRTYRCGRRRFLAARAGPTTEALHAWRRQVKHHGVHVRLLVPVWPDLFRARARAVDALSDVLGDDHDLAELERLAVDAGASKGDRRAVRRAVAPRREALQRAAWPLGARVYAETPRAFGDRVTACLVAEAGETARDGVPALRSRRRVELAPLL